MDTYGTGRKLYTMGQPDISKYLFWYGIPRKRKSSGCLLRHRLASKRSVSHGQTDFDVDDALPRSFAFAHTPYHAQIFTSLRAHVISTGSMALKASYPSELGHPSFQTHKLDRYQSYTELRTQTIQEIRSVKSLIRALETRQRRIVGAWLVNLDRLYIPDKLFEAPLVEDAEIETVDTVSLKVRDECKDRTMTYNPHLSKRSLIFMPNDVFKSWTLSPS
ncbi:hypothetical protein BASA60_007774 [Batrachochytrium salamandrivorans]|nr:hypothetical protein BASA60_007774 [Batrachochytrium salamandrivorans]